jgi:hypothetical protein
MNRSIQIVLLAIALSACRSVDVAKVNSDGGSETTVGTCELLVKFSSDEALKRNMLSWDHLRPVLVNEVSSTEKIVRMRVNCKSEETEALIYKLNQQEGVEWVRTVN